MRFLGPGAVCFFFLFFFFFLFVARCVVGNALVWGGMDILGLPEGGFGFIDMRLFLIQLRKYGDRGNDEYIR